MRLFAALFGLLSFMGTLFSSEIAEKNCGELLDHLLNKNVAVLISNSLQKRVPDLSLFNRLSMKNSGVAFNKEATKSIKTLLQSDRDKVMVVTFFRQFYSLENSIIKKQFIESLNMTPSSSSLWRIIDLSMNSNKGTLVDRIRSAAFVESSDLWSATDHIRKLNPLLWGMNEDELKMATAVYFKEIDVTLLNSKKQLSLYSFLLDIQHSDQLFYQKCLEKLEGGVTPWILLNVASEALLGKKAVFSNGRMVYHLLGIEI